MRLAVNIDVLAGSFASQQLAFAHLLDAAQGAKLSPDLDQVEIVPSPYIPRLSGFFDTDTVWHLINTAAGDVLILILPGALIAGQFPGDSRLRRLGQFDGQIVRAL